MGVRSAGILICTLLCSLTHGSALVPILEISSNSSHLPSNPEGRCIEDSQVLGQSKINPSMKDLYFKKPSEQPQKSHLLPLENLVKRADNAQVPERRLVELHARIDDLNEQLRVTKDRILDLSTRLHVSSRDLNRYAQFVGNFVNQINTMEMNVNSTQQKIADYQENARAAQDAKKVVDSLAQSVDVQRSNITRHTSEIAEIRSLVNHLGVTINSSNLSLEKIMTQLDKQKEAIAHGESSLMELATRIEAQEDRSARSDDKFADAFRQDQTTIAEVKRHDHSLLALQTNMTRLTVTINEIGHLSSSLEKNFSDTSENVYRLTQKVKDLKSRILANVYSIETNAQNISTLNRTTSVLTDAFRAVTDKVEGLSLELSNHSSILEVLHRQSQETEKQITALARTTEQNTLMSAQSQRANQSHSDSLRRIEQTLGVQNETIDSNTQAAATLQRDFEVLRIDVLGFKETLRMLKEQHQEQDERTATNQRQAIAHLRESLKETEKVLRDLAAVHKANRESMELLSTTVKSNGLAIAKHEQQVTMLRQNATQTTTRLRGQESSISSLDKRTQSVTENVAALGTLLRSFQAQMDFNVTANNARLEEVNELLKAVSEQLQDIAHSGNEASQSLALVKKELSSNHNNSKAHAEAIAELHAKVQTNTAVLARNGDLFHELTGKISNASEVFAAGITDLAEQVQRNAIQTAANEANLGELRVHLEHNMDRVAKADEAHHDLDQRLRSRENDLSNVSTTLEMLQKHLLIYADELSTVGIEVSNLVKEGAERQAIDQRSVVFGRLLDDHHARLKSTSRAVEILSTLTESLNRDVGHLKNRARARDDIITQNTASIAQVRSEIEKLNTKVEDYFTDISAQLKRLGSGALGNFRPHLNLLSSAVLVSVILEL